MYPSAVETSKFGLRATIVDIKATPLQSGNIVIGMDIPHAHHRKQPMSHNNMI